jgi:hypothetical protein
MRVKYGPIERDPKIRPYLEIADVEGDKELEKYPIRG